MIMRNKSSNNGSEPRLPEAPTIPSIPRQIETVHGEAITQFCTQASNAILAIADEVHAMADSFVAESKALSDNLLKCADLERERTLQFYQNIRDAVRSATAIRSTFDKSYNPGKPADEYGLPEAVEAALEKGLSEKGLSE